MSAATPWVAPWLAVLLACVACATAAPSTARGSTSEGSPSNTHAVPGPAAPAPAPAPAGAAPAPPMPPVTPMPPVAPVPCGPFECFWCDSAPSALGVVLAEQPLAIGIGEAHVLAGVQGVTSTARRFATELLPEIGARASHLVVELLAPDPRCESATREVRGVQEPVTAPQAKTNPSDYVELGRRARQLGIEPFVLSPTCDEYRAIAAAGDAAIDQMLGTIARVTSRMLRAAMVRNREQGRAAMVIGYGGALHNDIAPSAEKAAWSYGPDLEAFSGGRYVELDLIVRELIRDTDVWKALPWYAHFEPDRDPTRWLVMRTGPHRFAFFFPRDEPPQAR